MQQTVPRIVECACGRIFSEKTDPFISQNVVKMKQICFLLCSYNL